MFITLIKTIDYVIHILIILFIMKLVIDPREFFFNSALRPVDSITDPILSRIRKFINLNRYGIDYTPVIAISALICLYVLIHWLVPVQQKEFIKSISPDLTLLQAVVESLGKLVLFLIHFMAFSIFVLAMIPVYSKNPITGFFKDIIAPFGNFLRKKPKHTEKGDLWPRAGVVVFILGFIILIVLNSLVAPSLRNFALSWKNWVQPVLVICAEAIGIYRFLVFLLVASVILSWLDAEMRNPFINIVYMLTEPILLPVRRVIPPVAGLDLSPWIACIAIWITGRVITSFLFHLEQLFLL
jgi:YggT family protein